MGISHITWVFQFVQTAVPGLYSRIYMDDRSFVSRSPETLIAGVQAWQGWSSSVGLQESSGKTQVTATQATGCQDLAQNIDPGFVTTEFHVLGCTAQAVVRKESTAELKRIAAAQKSLQLLSNLRWSYERFWKAVQSHAMPKVSYGWLARLPTKATAWSLWAAVRRGQRVYQHANKFLRAIIWVGNCHLDILPCATLIRIVSKMIHCREARWADRLQCIPFIDGFLSMGTEPVGRGAGPLTMSPFWLIYVISKYRMLAMLLGKGGGGSCGNSLLTVVAMSVLNFRGSQFLIFLALISHLFVRVLKTSHHTGR